MTIKKKKPKKTDEKKIKSIGELTWHEDIAGFWLLLNDEIGQSGVCVLRDQDIIKRLKKFIKKAKK